MTLDPAQRRAVQAPGSVAVVAGAGTGKTHMLARRYLHHLLEGGLRPLEVVAVTFTRRAADELRARIRGVIKEALAAGDERLAEDTLLELEAAPIGTIHALAQRLCHAFPAEAELPPDVTVLDELEGRLWTAEALDAALERLDAAAVTALPFSLLKSAAKTLLGDPFRSEAALAKDAASLRAELEAARAAALEDACSAGWDDAVALLEAAAGPAEHPAEGGRRAALAAAAALSATLPAGRLRPTAPGASDAAAVAAEEQAWTVLAGLRPDAGRAGDWRSLGAADLGAVKGALRVLRDAARAVWQDGEGPAAWRWSARDERMVASTAALRRTFAEVRAALAERKRRAALVDFGDLEVHAVRALEQPAVRTALRSRWRAILVDEYQDTSPAQARLLELLRGEAPVTVVGDEKQSIYAFRGADVSVFRRERRRLSEEAGSTSVELITSYRSHERLVNSLNAVFEPVLGVDAAPLRAARSASTIPGAALRWLELDARKARPEEAALAEAERLALELGALLSAHPPVRVDDGAGGLRPLRAGDIAVLARSRASLEPFEAVAPALGLPVLNAGGGDVLSTPEGLDAQALLLAIVDRSDASAVLATLRGPFVAASDSAIHAFARGTRRPGPPWWSLLEHAEDPRLRAGAELLGELRSLHARGAAALELLREADARTGHDAVLANLPNAKRRLADWQGVLELVAALEAGSADAFGLARRLRRLREAGVAVPRPPLRSSDAVALLTIHAAKGLEWPVVAVVDLSRRPHGGRDDVMVDPDLGVTLRWRDGAGGWAEPALYRLACRRSREREAAEERRLAYVALTRARDALLLSARADHGGMLTLLRPGLEAAGLVPEVMVVSAGVAPPPPPLPSVAAGGEHCDDVDDADRFWAARPDAEPAAGGSASAVGGAASPVAPAGAQSASGFAPPLPPPDPFAASPLFAAAELRTGADWRRVLAALAILDEERTWLHAAETLAAAGVPPPLAADLLVTMVGPRGALLEAVMRWPGSAGRAGVALAAPEELTASLGPAAPHGPAGGVGAGGVKAGGLSAGGWTYLALDPLAPEGALGQLRSALAASGAVAGGCDG